MGRRRGGLARAYLGTSTIEWKEPLSPLREARELANRKVVVARCARLAGRVHGDLAIFCHCLPCPHKKIIFFTFIDLH
jgi:hypothetical protein